MEKANIKTVKIEGGRKKDRCIWRSSGAVSWQTCESRPEDCAGCPVDTALTKVASRKQRYFFSRDFFDQCFVNACAVPERPCPFTGPCMANWSRTNAAASRVLTTMGIGGLSIGTNASLIQQIGRRNGLHVDLVSRLFELRNLKKLGPEGKLTPVDLHLHTVEEQFALVASASFLDCLDSLDLGAFAESMFEKALLPHGLLNSVSEERTSDELWDAFWAIQGLAILDVLSAFDINVLRDLQEAIATSQYVSMTMAQMALTVQRVIKQHTHRPARLQDETVERAATLVGFAGGLLGKVYHGLSVTPSELAAAVRVSRVSKAVPEDGAVHAGRVLMDVLLRMADAGTLEAARAQSIVAGIVASGLDPLPGERTVVSRAVVHSFQERFKKLGDMRADPVSLLAIMGADNLVREADRFEALAGAEALAEETMEELDPALLGCEMPSDLFYSRGHSWVRPERDGAVRIGLDDLAAHLVGRADAVEMPEPGEHLRRGRPALRLIRGGKSVKVRSPMDGEVVMVNQSVIDVPDVLSTQPYGDGWLLSIRPEVSEDNLSGLMFGPIARRWEKSEAARLSEICRGRTEMATAADGATLAHDALAGIPGVHWSKVLRKFFRV